MSHLTPFEFNQIKFRIRRAYSIDTLCNGVVEKKVEATVIWQKRWFLKSFLLISDFNFLRHRRFSKINIWINEMKCLRIRAWQFVVGRLVTTRMECQRMSAHQRNPINLARKLNLKSEHHFVNIVNVNYVY